MDENSQANQNGKAKPEIEFNFDDFTADDFEDFNEALRQGKTKTAAEFYAKMIVRCPAEWGAANDPLTYRKLPYLKFRNLVRNFEEAVNEETKK